MHHERPTEDHCANCGPKKGSADWLLWISSAVIVASYAFHLFAAGDLAATPYLMEFAHSVFTFMNIIWWGVLLGILFTGMLAGVPQTLVRAIIGKGGTVSGVIRATLGGVFLDLCSHGILLVGMQLYKRGASLGQIMAFLIASPWNSLSLTIILWSLVGLPWTLALLVFSMIVAILSGIIFERLVKNGTLPSNPYRSEEEPGSVREEFRAYRQHVRLSAMGLLRMAKAGLMESKMILRWIFFGVVLAAALRAFVPADLFAQFFGPTVAGLAATLLFATVLEVCSEGSMPVAADFLLRANAPGNMFAFLMAGVSTDYTEILSLRETTKSWKIAFFLPLVTFPQIFLLALLLNRFS